MIGRLALGVLVAGAIAATAGAGPAASGYAALTPEDRLIVDALYAGQRPIAGSPPLNRDDIALLGADGGWGRVFRDLKAAGYYPATARFDRLVDRARRLSAARARAAAGEGLGGPIRSSGAPRAGRFDATR